ncbi:5-oxoprolinase subunit PxpB [Variovorax sp. 770b2]|jgi:KipI family sensor histidine kinase inhibitor|uniref:5-oxoprolinase subunit PxpB n=1 Tax=Variovorax sp. 770b2 TaxID=1566271 RepID=UPI0008F25641|nr:5-oxoprolinase subunit PxpB [Variovorax sp. 770b2]SFQ00973.1 sensor histidine kinase inhibitor, KipI family [Variovorax sp. 770b2]
MSGSPPPRLHLLGDAALLCELPAPATLVQQQRIWALAAQAREWPGVGEVLPGMNNLTLTFDPTAIALDALMAQVLAAWPKLSAKAVEGRLVEVPVAYGGEHGPDLGDVAAHTGLTPAEVVRRHSAGEYVVYLLGFLPGFAFMGGLAPELATPRRAEPRTAVPARSVGIGGEQTGIYPLVSPGGWQLIGRTSLEMFDPAAEPPTLLRPGDRVRFVVESVET